MPSWRECDIDPGINSTAALFELTAVGTTSRRMAVRVQGDNLGKHYAAVASDGSAAGKQREAASMFSKAEGHLDSEADNEALDCANQALALFKGLQDNSGIADTLRLIIHVDIFANQRKQAAARASEELENFRKSGNKSGEAKMLLSLAEANYDCRGAKYREAALNDAATALDMFRSQQDKTMEGMALLVLMNIQMKMKSDAQALRTAGEALEIFAFSGDKKSQALAMHGKAAVSVRCGAFEEGVKLALGAVQLFRESGLRKLEAFEMHCIANWHLKEEKAEDAISWAEKSMDVFRKIQYRKGQSAALDTLVQANIAAGDALAAVEEAQAALKAARKAADAEQEASALEMIVLAQIAHKDQAEALTAAEKAVQKIGEAGQEHRTWQINMMRTVARLQAKNKNPSKAVRVAEDAGKLADELDDPVVKAAVLRTLSEVLYEKGDYDKALSTALEEKIIHKDRGDTTKEAEAGVACGRAYLMKGQNAKCFDVAMEAVNTLRETGDRSGQALALHMVAKVYAAKKEFENSLRAAERASRLFRDGADKTSESRALLTASTSAVMVCAEGGRGPMASKPFNEQMEKAGRQSNQAMRLAFEVGEEKLYAEALRICAQITMYRGLPADAVKLATEAATVARSQKDDKGEASARVILSEALIASGKFPKASEAAEIALELFRKVKDASGESTALYLLQKIEGETAQFDMVRRDPTAEGQAATADAPKQAESKAEDSLAVPDRDKFLATLPMPERVGFQLKELIQGIVGKDRAVDSDAAVMEAGLTSISAIMLRDQISDVFPDASEDMEMTFAFEYPTVRAMTEYIMEAIGEE
jgi:hypothetical protein